MVLLYDAAAIPSTNANNSNTRQDKSKMQQAYSKAIQSIAKYPLMISSADEAEELQGIGNFLAARIGKILTKLGIAPSSGANANVRTQSASAAAAPAAASVSPALARSISANPPSSHVSITSPSSRPIVPLSVSSTLPECPFGILCYRTNAAHFQQQSHPADHPMQKALLESPAARHSGDSQSRSGEKRRHSSDRLELSDIDELSQESKKMKMERDPMLSTSFSRTPSLVVAFGGNSFPTEDNTQVLDEDDDGLIDLTSPSPPVPRTASTSSLNPPAASSSTLPITNRAIVNPSHPVNKSSSLPAAVTSAPRASSSSSVSAAASFSRPDKLYRPKAGSSPYLLLLALSQSSSPLNKSQLLANASALQPVDKPATLDATSLWSGMSTLLAKDLANKSLTPSLYSLTALGKSTAVALWPSNSPPDPSSLRFRPSSSVSPFPNLSPSPSPSAAAASPIAVASSPSISPFIAQSLLRQPSSSWPVFAPVPSRAPSVASDLARRYVKTTDFEVILLIDIRERSGRKDASYMAEKLSKSGHKCETRSLAVSDFMYVARSRSVPSVEIVLDVIIERKRVSDLVSSIKDGRYHEQRNRLKKTQLRRLIYIIEGRVAEDTVIGVPLKTVESVLASMNGVHGILVHHSPTIEPTISFLASLHQLLENEIKENGVPVVLNQSVQLQPFVPSQQILPNLAEILSVPAALLGAGESFMSFTQRTHKSANLLAKELFGTQLRMIRGLSANLVLNLLDKYPCAQALMEAYKQCRSTEEEENMLENMSRGPFQSVFDSKQTTLRSTR